MAHLKVEREGAVYFCAGTIVTSDTVVTAANCLEDVSHVVVITGTVNFNEHNDFTQWRITYAFGYHEDFHFDAQATRNDIGYVHVGQDFYLNDYVNVARVAEEEAAVGELITIEGCGGTAENSPPNGQLNYAENVALVTDRSANIFIGAVTGASSSAHTRAIKAAATTLAEQVSTMTVSSSAALNPSA